MAHAHHFLSRLDRVSMPQVELALGLYRDEELLRFIIEKAHIPDGVERVALSLEHPENGPFVIITRAGRFVTCLGAGMKPRDDQPIITRGQLDAFASKREALQQRITLADGRGVRQLLRRIYEAADLLSREDFLAISSLQPLFAQVFLGLYVEGSADLLDARKLLLLQLGKSNKPAPMLKEPLLLFWRTLWSLGHLAVLACMDGSETLPDSAIALFGSRSTLSWPAVNHGFAPVALRGAWAAARMGKPMVPQYKQSYSTAGSLRRTIDGALGLCAIGMRHSKLRAEIGKFMENEGIEFKGKNRHDALLESIQKFAYYYYKAARANPEELIAHHRRGGARLWHKMCELGAVRQGPYFAKRVEDVPDEVAMPMGIGFMYTYLLVRDTEQQLTTISRLFEQIYWVARSAPEDLYLPADAQKAFMLPWGVEKPMSVLLAFREHNERVSLLDPKRPKANEGPARQGPCPCGSGKKYKRCCEEKEKAEKQKAAKEE